MRLNNTTNYRVKVMDNRAASSSHDSEGFYAHLYLSGGSSHSSSPTRWEADYHSPKLARLLTKKSRWKTVKTRAVIYPAACLRKPKQLTLDFSVDEKLFNSLVERWRKETRYVSTLSRMAMHPAYQRIIGFGREAVPLILRELQQRGGHWLWALNAITGEDPAPDDATFDVAKEAWLAWGRQHGHLT